MLSGFCVMDRMVWLLERDNEGYATMPRVGFET